jgi:hypothetical protein
MNPVCPNCGGKPLRETIRFDGTPLYIDKCGSWYDGQIKAVETKKLEKPTKKKSKIDNNPKLSM